MEITIDRKTLSTTLILVGLLVLLGLAALGRSYTVTTEAGTAKILSWEDWQLAKAQKHFGSERNILRADATSLAILLDRAPDPVAAQLLAGRIGQHTSAGVSVLQPARTALLQAAQDVVSWSAGALDRDTAVASLQAAVVLLK